MSHIKTDTKSKLAQFLSFKIENEEYGIDAENVLEIITDGKINQSNTSMDSVDGNIMLRGLTFPVLNMRKWFRLPVLDENNLKQTIILVKISGKSIGIAVDSVSKVMHTQQKNSKMESPMSGEEDREFIRGIVKTGEKLIVVLSLKWLFDGLNINQSAMVN